MESLYLLIPISVLLVFAIGAAFWYSLRGGQFDDLEGPAYRVVMDDDRPVQPEDSNPINATEKSESSKT
jgi:cbb3-type cytochrome oxidase maturation protein